MPSNNPPRPSGPTARWLRLNVLAKTPDAVHIGADQLMLDAADHYSADILAAVGLREYPAQRTSISLPAAIIGPSALPPRL
jgi:hypothetical protein